MKKSFKLIIAVFFLVTASSCFSGKPKKKQRRSQISQHAVRRMPAYNRQAIEKSQGVPPVIPVVYDEKAEYVKLLKDLKEEIKASGKTEQEVKKKVPLREELTSLTAIPKDSSLPAKDPSSNIIQNNADEAEYRSLLKQDEKDNHPPEDSISSTTLPSEGRSITFVQERGEYSKVPITAIPELNPGLPNILNPEDTIIPKSPNNLTQEKKKDDYIVPPTTPQGPRFVIATSPSYEGVKLEEAKNALGKFGRVKAIRLGEKFFIVVEPPEGLYTEVEAKHFFNLILQSSFLDIYIKKI